MLLKDINQQIKDLRLLINNIVLDLDNITDEKFNKSAARRIRVNSVALAKMFKDFRHNSLEYANTHSCK